jgi:hypothetical protein
MGEEEIKAQTYQHCNLGVVEKDEEKGDLHFRGLFSSRAGSQDADLPNQQQFVEMKEDSDKFGVGAAAETVKHEDGEDTKTGGRLRCRVIGSHYNHEGNGGVSEDKGGEIETR